MDDLEVECRFVPIPKNRVAEKPDKKLGLYTQSHYPIKGFGVKRWVISAYIELDYDKYRSEGYTDDQIAEGCARFLSKPPPRKKYQKKKPVPLYGQLEPLPALWRDDAKYSFHKKNGFENRFVVQFITDQRKNKEFWDEGPQL